MIKYDAQAKIPTDFGIFLLQTYPEADTTIHLLLLYGTIKTEERVLVRIHSKCFTGETFGALRCDCRPQLIESMRQIAERGSGLIIYLDQEGRGIGLLNKIRAYSIQDDWGKDTVDANLALDLPVDNRKYNVAIEILNSMKLRKVALLTNNPTKMEALIDAGFDVKHMPLVIGVNEMNIEYLATKKNRLHHIIPLDDLCEKRERL